MRYLSILFLVIGCTSSEYEDNQVLKNSIDGMPYSECYLSLVVDSLDNIIDTVDLIMNKLNHDGEKMFSRREYKHKNQSYFVNTYYWENGTDFLSYGESESKDFVSRSEVFRNRVGEIQKLVSFEKFGEERDTFLLNYHYSYEESGKKIRLEMLADSALESVVHIFNYNPDEKVQSEFTVIEGDTFEAKHYFYSGKQLKKSEKYRNSLDTTITVQYYGKSNMIDSILRYVGKNATIELKSKTVYKYTNELDLIEYVTKDYDFKTKKRVTIVKLDCD